MAIHPTAIIDPRAEIDSSAEVGAYAVVEAGVKIGEQVRLWPHAFISSGTTLGPRCQVHPFAVLGHFPQDLKWKQTPSYMVAGADCVFREGCQVHRGTAPESTTRLGDRVYVMATGHVGHNCDIGDDVIVANAALLAGHVVVGPRTMISGCTAVHQFTRIGEFVMIGGGMRINGDVPPFMLAGPGGILGPNTIGLRRGGFAAQERLEIRNAYKLLYRSGVQSRDAIDRLASQVRTPPGERLVEFLRAPSKRGLMRWKPRAAPTDGVSDETLT